MKTKVIFSIVLVFFLILSCKSDKKKTTKIVPKDIFKITGNLKTFPPEQILLQKKEADKFITLLIAKGDNSSFLLNSIDSFPIDQYYIKVGNYKNRIPIFIDNSDLEIAFDIDSIEKSTIMGNSALQKKYKVYSSGLQNTKNIFLFKSKFITENKESLISATVLKGMLGDTEWRLNKTKELFNELSPTVQSSILGKNIISYISSGLEQVSKLSPSEIKKANAKDKAAAMPAVKPIKIKTPKAKWHITEYAPFFYANDPDGQEKAVKNIFSKNKFVLIDFWASWCNPCRAQNPELVRLYNKYHSKGFEIVSISEDQDLNNMNVAIIQDGMIWKHLVDDHKRVASMYHVGTIPRSFLVNSQGGIINNNISTGKLAAFLQQEFGN